MSLKRRLILAAVYILVVVTIGLEVPLALTVSKQATQLEENRVVRNTTLLAARINDDLGDPQMSVDPTVASAPRSFIAGLVQDTASIVPGGETPIRYVVVDRPGRVVADSDRIARVGTLYATPERPEFQGVFDLGGDVRVEQRYSDTLKADLLIVTVPVVHVRKAIGAVRATETLAAVQAGARRTWIGFGIVGLVAILVGVTATWFLAGSVVRPVKQLEDAAVRLGRGELDARAEPTGPKEIATLARAFNRTASALSANLSAQKDFLANASHQLRTPLTGLRLRLEAIKDQGGNASEQAAKAEVEVDRLAGLVEGLLVLARASSIESTGADVDLAEASRAAVDRWAETAARSGKIVQLGRCEPATAWTDTDDVNHVLDNLIENAIRYTPEGTVITVEAASASGDSLIAVEDTGPGIPPAERERLFERFYRGSAGRQGGPGTGLGLAIVQELVGRWGGRVEVRDGRGTRFEARFAREPRPAKAPEGGRVPPAIS